MFRPHMGGTPRAPCLAGGLDAMHSDRMHMQRYDTSHQRQQGQSDASVAGRCSHPPIIRPNAPLAGIEDLDRPQLALGGDWGPCPARRTSISATTDLNRLIVYVSARASPTLLNSPSLEAFRRSGPPGRTYAAALSSLSSDLPLKNHAVQEHSGVIAVGLCMALGLNEEMAQVAQAAHEGGTRLDSIERFIAQASARRRNEKAWIAMGMEDPSKTWCC